MISYKPLWKTLKTKGLKKQYLVDHGINKATMDRLNHDKNITTRTLDDICMIVKVPVNEVIECKWNDLSNKF